MKASLTRHIMKTLRMEKAALTEAFAEDLAIANVFLMPVDTTDLKSETKVAEIHEELKTHFTVEQRKLIGDNLPLDLWLKVPSHAALIAFFIYNVNGDTVSSVLQSFLAQHVADGLQEQRNVRLSDYGVLLPRTCKIRCYSFAHGKGHYYRFRLAMHKLNRMPQRLLDFLLALSSNCPNDLFSTGPRASNFEVNLHVDVTHVKTHPCIDYAKAALNHRRFKSVHEDVEKYLLENDPDCVATEVPLWLNSAEMKLYHWLHHSKGCLTGHIDVLRCEDDHIVSIWDFKPSAASTITAKGQVYLYALMLSARTGITLDSIRCGYFDDEDAFLFEANQVTHF